LDFYVEPSKVYVEPSKVCVELSKVCVDLPDFCVELLAVCVDLLGHKVNANHPKGQRKNPNALGFWENKTIGNTYLIRL
jgi:hypothetical protein